MLEVLDNVNTPEESLPEQIKEARLMLYRDSNDAFRDLLLGKFGRLPLGFPPDWVYESAFGPEWKKALESRTEESPLNTLEDMDLEPSGALASSWAASPDEEFVIYLNHPADALKTIASTRSSATPTTYPWTPGSRAFEPGKIHFGPMGKPHEMDHLRSSRPDTRHRAARYSWTRRSCPRGPGEEPRLGSHRLTGDGRPATPTRWLAPSSGDLWVMYVKPGDLVKKGEEMFNISIMKQEKAVYSPVDGSVKRVLKTANFQDDRKMVPVVSGELLVELGPVSKVCSKCKEPICPERTYQYCPLWFAGRKL